jgi:hypothetical protein
MNMNKNKPKTDQVFQCPGCGLHYRDQATAQACEEFCLANKACNLNITKHSIENEANQS